MKETGLEWAGGSSALLARLHGCGAELQTAAVLLDAQLRRSDHVERAAALSHAMGTLRRLGSALEFMADVFEAAADQERALAFPRKEFPCTPHPPHTPSPSVSASCSGD